jgi:bacterial/archaeal transporter family protein
LDLLGRSLRGLRSVDGDLRQGRGSGCGLRLRTFIRAIVILFVAAAVLRLASQWRPLSSITGRTYLFLALSGAATGASWLCYFRALKLGPAAQVAPIDKLSVVMVAAFGVVFLDESLSKQNWVGVALIALGAVLVAWRE